ncbi:MAG: hypothetical protein WCO84_09550, partial [bacterium]
YRVEPHCGIIADVRPKEEREEWHISEKDPLNRLASGHPQIFTPECIAAIEDEIKSELDETVNFSRQSPFPAVSDFIREFNVR